MNRVSLYCFYEANGNVRKADLELLHELKSISSSVIMIVNGKIHNREKCEQLVERIVIRENEGFDAGAIASFLFDYDGIEFIKKYDELVICNSSFIGPFISLKSLFENMEEKNCDFWGISKTDINLCQHIQSYFQVYKSKIINDARFYEYFKKNIWKKSLTYWDVCRVYENGLYSHLIKYGYSSAAFCERISCDNYRNPLGSIAIDQLPVIKKKIFNEIYCTSEQVVETLRWIQNNTNYNMDNIFDYAEVQMDQLVPMIKPQSDLFEAGYSVSWQDVSEFIDGDERIYIYGDGNNADHIFRSFIYGDRENRFSGFVISDISKNKVSNKFGYPIYSINEAELDSKVIVALSKENTNDIRKNIKNKNVMYLWDV